MAPLWVLDILGSVHLFPGPPPGPTRNLRLELKPLSVLSCLRGCRNTRSGNGVRTPQWWRCWRSSRPSRCRPRFSSRSCRCCSLVTILSAPLQTCTPTRCTSPWPLSPTTPEVRMRGSAAWETLGSAFSPQGVWRSLPELPGDQVLTRQDPVLVHSILSNPQWHREQAAPTLSAPLCNARRGIEQA